MDTIITIALKTGNIDDGKCYKWVTLVLRLLDGVFSLSDYFHFHSGSWRSC